MRSCSPRRCCRRPAPSLQTVKGIRHQKIDRRQEMRQLTMFFFGLNTVAKWVIINHAKLFSTSVLSSPCSIFANCERHPSSENRQTPRNEATHHVFFWPEYSSEVGYNKSCETVLHVGAVGALLYLCKL